MITLRLFRVPALSFVIVLLAVTFLIYTKRNSDPMLFQHGTLEVPDNRAFAIMNPFRDKASERTARRLFNDLRKGNCEQILVANRINHDPRTCNAVSGSDYSRLIWREDKESIRTLVYHFENKSRVFVYFHREEGGFGINSISAIR